MTWKEQRAEELANERRLIESKVVGKRIAEILWEEVPEWDDAMRGLVLDDGTEVHFGASLDQDVLIGVDATRARERNPDEPTSPPSAR